MREEAINCNLASKDNILIRIQHLQESGTGQEKKGHGFSSKREDGFAVFKTNLRKLQL